MKKLRFKSSSAPILQAMLKSGELSIADGYAIETLHNFYRNNGHNGNFRFLLAILGIKPYDQLAGRLYDLCMEEYLPSRLNAPYIRQLVNENHLIPLWGDKESFFAVLDSCTSCPDIESACLDLAKSISRASRGASVYEDANYLMQYCTIN